MIEITLKFATLDEAAKELKRLADAESARFQEAVDKINQRKSQAAIDTATHPPAVWHDDGSVGPLGAMGKWFPAEWAPEGMTRTKPETKRKKGGGR